jgi:hypothetical protein
MIHKTKLILTFIAAIFLLTSLIVATITITPSYGQEEQQQEITRGIAAGEYIQDPKYGPVFASLQNNAVPQNQACDGSSKGGLVAGANSLSSEKLLYIQPY